MIHFYQKRTQRPGGLVKLVQGQADSERSSQLSLTPFSDLSTCAVKDLDLKYLDLNSGFTSCLTLGMISNLSTPVSPKQGIVIETVNQRAVLKVK